VQRSPLASDAAAAPQQKRLEFVDGLRGLAAVYVVCHHAYHELTWKEDGGGLPHHILQLARSLAYGHYAVAIFIVLSGYCLMLPIARSADGRLRGGFKAYILRRARRILPPYYAALGLCLLLIALTPSLQHPADAHWDSALPALTLPATVTHLLLIHTFWAATKTAIDPPMWSIATEWQIYFALPWILLPISRRFGKLAMLGTAFVIAWAPTLLPNLPLAPFLIQAEWTFLSAFACGMLAAQIGVSPHPGERALRERIPWGSLTIGLALLTAVAALSRLLIQHRMLGDVLVGFTMMALLIYCTGIVSGTATRTIPWALKLLQARPLVSVGVFSYSLYLIHFPILALIHIQLRALHLAPVTRLGVLLFVGTPVCIAAAYLFHLAFEKPFLAPVRKPIPSQSS